jgi:type IV pilus assembly protein PilB
MESKMQGRARIGELLSRMVPLSGHDVEEILQEQASNRRRFGEIALSWGLCRPEHVWDAWVQQSADGTENVDLDKIGVDTQAAALLPADVARQYGMIPVRAANDAVLIATSDAAPERASEALAQLLHRRIKFVRADREQLHRVLEMYYPSTSAQAG